METMDKKKDPLIKKDEETSGDPQQKGDLTLSDEEELKVGNAVPQ